MRESQGKAALRSGATSEAAAATHRIMRSIRRWLLTAGGCAALVVAPLSACSALPRSRVVSLHSLESAPPAAHLASSRWLVADPSALARVRTPIGTRLDLIVVRCERDRQALRRALGTDIPPMDFSQGILVGVASRAGLPLSGGWPLHITALRIFDGAGLLSATFDSGTYLPCGAAMLEAAFVPGLSDVLALEINGERFYPQ